MLQVLQKYWVPTESYADVLSFLRPISSAYPHIDYWFNTKVVPGVRNGTRHIVRIQRDGQLVAVGIAKKDNNERKICTVRVAPAHQGQGLGTLVFNDLIQWLETDRPVITVSEENKPSFERIFERHGFILTSVENGLYRQDRLEFVFNHPLSPLMR